jgi:hypothetical protein
VKSPTLNFQELLRRLGVGGGGVGLEIIESVQPVVSVAELSSLVPTLPPVSSTAGGAVTGGGTAATAPALQLTANRSGLAADLVVSQGGQGVFRWATSDIGSEILTLAGTIIPTDQPVSGGGVLSGVQPATLVLGTALNTAIPVTRPFVHGPADALEHLEFYLPAGQVFELSVNANLAVLGIWATLAEIDAR